MKAVNTYSKLIKQNVSIIAALRRANAELRAQRQEVNVIGRILRKLNPDFRASTTAGKVTFHCQYDQLDTFKDKKLVAALGKLSDVMGTEFSSADYPDYSNRDFRISNDRYEIMISAYLKDQPSGCQRVQVGTERHIVEKPIYEMRCS